MSNAYLFNDVLTVGKQATADVTHYLEQEKGYKVENVEDMPEYQKKDIDLIAHTSAGTMTIEVKGDRYFKTGNYFIETVSNRNKETLGCILYSEADFLFYYFVEPKELHIIDMKKLQHWFKKNSHRFQERYVRTKGSDGKIIYSSEGKLVPRIILAKEVGVTVRGL
ncbi:hypothetical protein P9695_14870 [Weizmannia sp. CD-2023]|uniref:hypothetical protein n=1 Tax=Heyndrickxia TaxID=2837504 RepID=UPI002E1C8F8C|nr:hypothetical protein [Weizmannia sp. CD-2023]MED4899780.1 hypothetical protein [Weizmannia sp. CD-2023]